MARNSVIRAAMAGDVEGIEQGPVHLINAPDRQGFCALHWACRSKRPQAVKALLKRGADPEVRDAKGKTPMHWALAYGYNECVQMLMEYGAESRVSDDAGENGERLAARLGRGQKALAILEAERDARTERIHSYLYLLWAFSMKPPKHLPRLPPEIIPMFFPRSFVTEMYALKRKARVARAIPQPLAIEAPAPNAAPERPPSRSKEMKS